jgi:hypothetical protein
MGFVGTSVFTLHILSKVFGIFYDPNDVFRHYDLHFVVHCLTLYI